MDVVHGEGGRVVHIDVRRATGAELDYLVSFPSGIIKPSHKCSAFYLFKTNIFAGNDMSSIEK
jgi:hypothetical protein